MKLSSHSLLLFLLLASAALRLSSAATSPYPDQTRPTKSGFLTVNPTSGSSMFYAYYESQAPPNKTTPILIWLQGGPGCSSMLANFLELGPFLLNQNLTLSPNPYSWNNLFGLLFLDNPLGTGFSSPQQIPRNQEDVSKHPIASISEFMSLNTSFQTRPIYITGESYAGKYNPVLGYSILNHNAGVPAGRRINLAGISIGNGLTDPTTQVQTHATTCYNLGLINQKQRTLVEEIQSEAVEFAMKKKWKESADARNDVLGSLANFTGLATLYDFRRLSVYQTKVVSRFLNKTEVQEALGVKEWRPYYTCSKAVIHALHEDVMKSVSDKVEFLVKNGVKILLYQGNCDLRDGVFSAMSWIEKMKGDVIDGFLKAERKVWKSEDEMLAGYVQKYKNFSHVVVMNAGHLVPTDQPMNSQTMIQDWVLERNLFG